MYHSVYDEKLNLLAWAIRLIFSDQVTKILTSSYNSASTLNNFVACNFSSQQYKIDSMEINAICCILALYVKKKGKA